ncbi:MAG TPA: hypothetical protein VFL04_03055 [Rectinemataceae bacterium]|nr:hypothetical protein [Rectinemataceae bacterium]
MSTLKMSLSFENFAISAWDRAGSPALRIVLLPGELISVPRKESMLRVVSGRAWASYDGKDYDLGPGATLELETRSDSALIQAMEAEALVFEVR